MKTKTHLTLFLLIFTISFSICHAQSFVHPGILHTQQDFDRMAQKVNANEQPWKGSYDLLVASSEAQLGWNPRATATVIRGGAGDNVALLYRDVQAAYQHALIYKITGNTAHGDKARDILNAWSATHTTLTGNADRYLASGLFGYQFANAAEMMRGYSGFDVPRFQNYLLDVYYYPLIERFLLGNEHGADHNDACITNYWANWDLANMAAMVAIGVFCDNRAIYNKGIEYFKSGAGNAKGGGNGVITKAIPFVHSSTMAQWQESGRDQGHTILGIGLMASFCEIAWNQGDDMYAFDDYRFRKAANYVAAYNNGQNVPFSTYSWENGQNCAYNEHTGISGAGRGEVRAIWEMIYNHYANRVGQASLIPWVAQEAADLRPEGGPGGHATTYDQPGFGSLTHYGETSNLKIYYSFDNSLLDTSGNGFHASSANPVFAKGKKGESISLDGVEGFVEIPAEVFDHITDMTLGTWINFNVEGEYEVFSIGSAGQGMSLKTDAISGEIKFTIANGATVEEVQGSGTLPLKGWSHLTVVLDTGTGILYLNGQEIGRNQNVTLNPSGLGLTGKGYIGLSEDHSVYFNGLVDDFRIYDTALNAYYVGDIAGAPVGEAPQIKSSNIINVSQGEGFQWAIEADFFPTNYEASGLPDGIILNSATGIISGIAQEAGVFNIELVVENVYGASSSEMVLMVRSQTDDGLIAHYRQEFDMTDVSSNRFHGEFVGQATYVPGRYGFGLELDGADDYVLLPSGIVITLNDFTIAVWVNVKSDNEWARIFDFGSGTDVYMFLTPRSEDGTLRFAIKNGGSEQFVEQAQPLTTGVWRHVAITLSGNTGRLYVNGNEVAVNPALTLRPSDLGATTQNYLGKSQWPDPYFQGIIDDFRIYDHALDADEIRELYQYDPGIPTGTYNITASHSEHVLGIEGEIKEGASVAQQASEDCKCQVWQVFRVGNSQYNLISLDTELYLQAMVKKEDAVSDVVLQPRIPAAPSQRFVLLEADSGYYSIISEEQHLALTVRDSSLAVGTEVHQMVYSNGANQQWSFSPVTVEDPILSVGAQNMDTKMMFYPNPASDYLIIDTKGGDRGTATIYDLSGKILDIQKFKGEENKVDVRDLKPGIYLVALQSDRYRSFIRFIKE